MDSSEVGNAQGPRIDNLDKNTAGHSFPPNDIHVLAVISATALAVHSNPSCLNDEHSDFHLMIYMYWL